jgi:hypothetical protein
MNNLTLHYTENLWNEFKKKMIKNNEKKNVFCFVTNETVVHSRGARRTLGYPEKLSVLPYFWI